MRSDREMTLEEWLNELPTCHKAHREYQELKNGARHQPTCETCGWWEGSKWVGPCGNPVVSNSLNDETEKDFGCIHHEPREEDQSDE